MEESFAWIPRLSLRGWTTPDFVKYSIIVATTYFLSGYIGLDVLSINKFATLVWAPTGIALVAVLFLGYRVWPAITIGAFCVNVVTGANPLLASALACGNTLEALLGVYLLDLVGFDIRLERISDAVKLICLAGLVSTVVSATIGTGSLFLGKEIGAGAIGQTWWAWWLGDILGDIVVASTILLVWASLRKVYGRPNLFELGIWAAVIVGSGLLIFARHFDVRAGDAASTYVLFPLFIWGAIRLGQPYLSLGVLGLYIIAIAGTLHLLGPYNYPDFQVGLFRLQMFILVLSSTTLVMTAAVGEARRARERERELNASLRKEIKEVERLNGLMMSYIKENRMKKLKRYSVKSRDD